jgi:23S rRNA pseudouridine1911/1915/1917 synthase
MIAVDKPAGIVVHPTYKNPAGTLLDMLRSPSLPRPSIVGRLDKLTSGIVVVAKSPDAHAALQKALASADAEKEYVAIVRGRVDVPEGRINLRIRVDERDRRRVIASDHQGAPSVTLFERLRVAGDFSVLKCRPLTGRRHQIRAHLSAAGWPILGDAVYGPAADLDWAGTPKGSDTGPTPDMNRYALHAARLSFFLPLPITIPNPPGSVHEPRIDISASIPIVFDLFLTLLS